MTTRLSLRTQILIGAVLWTIGLFVAASVVITQIMFHHPTVPRAFHNLFAHAHTALVIAIVCLLLGFSQVRRAVSAIHRLRTRLGDVHNGREQHVEGHYPSEVQPLVDDLNALLEHRGQAVARAQAKAGDLAHGLKTPLAVLAQEADRANAAGHTDLASSIGEQVDRMRRQIDYHLAHARAAASGATPGARCSVASSADGLARTLLRLHAGRGLTIDVHAPPAHMVRCQREDLDEILGNLLDNACKWCRSTVVLTSTLEGPNVIVTVDDDGTGLEASKREVVLQRGVRADETAPGSGFGLAIVRDLTELYGGTIELDASPANGVRARVTLPSA